MAELKKIFQKAEERKVHGRQTLLFIDEIHRFNKLQQDGLFGATERGVDCVGGATTENPSFSINNALLSRVQVLVLESLTKDDLAILYERARNYYLEDRGNGGKDLQFTATALEKLLQIDDGIGRKLLNFIEKVYLLIDWGEGKSQKIDVAKLIDLIERGTPTLLRYDPNDQHYNLISALHKSLRGSDCDTGLYWLSRMLTGGRRPTLFV